MQIATRSSGIPNKNKNILAAVTQYASHTVITAAKTSGLLI
jgi:hypothetical protein